MMMVLEEKQLNRFHLCSEATTPIREQGARMTQMLEPNPTWPQPTDELDTEIKEDQVADEEQRALEVAWDRLAATTSKDYSPTTGPVAKDSVSAQYRRACSTGANWGQEGWYYPGSKRYSPCTI
ncbi:hypothetical protein E8E15_001393 [Penicillium rubens]|nr:hypothetical protein E8E15_001393 [Penicillium rubens]